MLYQQTAILLIPFLGTSLGSAMVFFTKNKINEKFQKFLLGFASGVMIAASVWSLIIPGLISTYYVIILRTSLIGIPKEMTESAELDGANAFQKFRNITLPGIKTIMLMTILLRAIQTFGSPDLIYSMTQGGPAGSSNIITSYMMQLVQSLDYGLASAVGVLCILFLIVFAAIYLVATKYTDEEA